MLIPENLNDFLLWFKEVTEASWAKRMPQSDQGIAHLEIKWIGMSNSEIDQTEKKYSIKFPPDYREFLKILHTLSMIEESEQHFFFNWLGDEQKVNDKLDGPYSGLLHDGMWLSSWGVKPGTQDIAINRLNKWYREAPKLLPIFGHRYIVSEPCKNGNPVLSVYGTDIIVYGWDLKTYLLHEFEEDLPRELFEQVYDNEDNCWYSPFKEEVQSLFDSSWLNSSYDDILYWGELIIQNEGGWRYQP